MIAKGTISALYEGGRIATIKPYLGDVVTPKLVVQFHLWECLEVGMPVVYAVFEDSTGTVLARMDGEWNHKIWDGVEIVTGDVKVTEGDVEVVKGDIHIKSGDLTTQPVRSYNNHKHTCPDGSTSAPS